MLLCSLVMVVACALEKAGLVTSALCKSVCKFNASKRKWKCMLYTAFENDTYGHTYVCMCIHTYITPKATTQRLAEPMP